MSLLDAIATKDPIGKTKQLSVRLRPDVHAKLTQSAAQAKTSANELLGRLVDVAAELPEFALDAATSFTAFVKSEQVLAELSRSVNDRIGELVFNQDYSEWYVMPDDIRIKTVQFWGRTLEFGIGWDLTARTQKYDPGPQHADINVTVSGGGKIYLSPKTDLRISKEALEVKIVRTGPPPPPMEADGFIDDDLPF